MQQNAVSLGAIEASRSRQRLARHHEHPMRFRHTHLVHIPEVVLPRGVSDLVVCQDSVAETTVILTHAPDSYADDIDHRIVLCDWLLSAFRGGNYIGGPEEWIPREVAELRSNRLARFPHGVFGVIQVSGEFGYTIPERLGDFIDYRFSIEDSRGAEVSALLAPQRHAAVCALTLALPQIGRVEALSTGTAFLPSDGLPIIAVNSTSTADLTVSKPLSDQEISEIARTSALMLAKPQLGSVAKLVAFGLERYSDRLRAFMSSWAALEMLTQKLFSAYRLEWLSLDASIEDPELAVRVTAGKVALLEKFRVVTEVLVAPNAASDATEFSTMKEHRDQLYHTGSVDEAQLRPDRASALVRKYYFMALQKA